MASYFDYLANMQGYGPMLPPALLNGTASLGANSYMPPVSPMASSPVLSKAMLDGTMDFGTNSVPGGYGTGSLNNNISGSVPNLKNNWWDSLLGTRDQQGWGGLALGAASGLASTYLGMKQYGLAKDTFEENKRQSAQNFDAQRGLTNSRLEDRQLRRNIERPDSMAAADYMAKYGVK